MQSLVARIRRALNAHLATTGTSTPKVGASARKGSLMTLETTLSAYAISTWVAADR
jgi:hypothetical protein